MKGDGMKKMIPIRPVMFCTLLLIALLPGGIFSLSCRNADRAPVGTGDNEYLFWRAAGAHAASVAKKMLAEKGIRSSSDGWIALTNAGYARVNGRTTQGGLDGVAQAVTVSRGDLSLLEIHSAPNAALWFALYHESSGNCAYFEVDAAVAGDVPDIGSIDMKKLFSIKVMEKIDAEHLFENAAEYAGRFDEKIFGGNEFRIVTIANAAAAGAPVDAIRAMEFHDHYCPGVTSGVLLASYLKNSFPLETGGGYFIHSVQPWCKEDALMAVLNVTPGKGGYAVSYSTPEDRATWIDGMENAATIVYRMNPGTGRWDGIVVGFTWGEPDCPSYGHSVIDKLCTDLWYLERLDHPEQFITVLYTFVLPQDVTPKEYARPGVDPMERLGLTR